MAWAEWMEWEISDAQEYALRALELELRETIKHQPEDVIRRFVVLARKTEGQASVILKATRRIAELEVAQAIAEPAAPGRHD